MEFGRRAGGGVSLLHAARGAGAFRSRVAAGGARKAGGCGGNFGGVSIFFLDFLLWYSEAGLPRV